MPRTSRPSRRDKNHIEVRDALLAAGYTVAETHAVGGGVPDLFAAKAGVTIAVEVKSAEGRLNAAEERWMGDWKGEACVAHSPEEALQWCEGIIRRWIPA